VYGKSGVENVAMLTGEEINGPLTYLIFLNGLIIGVHSRPVELVDRVTTNVMYRMLAVNTNNFYGLS
jgi:hypothetical protein